MRVNDIAEFSATIGPGATETLVVDTEERNATLVMLSIEDGTSGEAVYHTVTWEFMPTNTDEWRFYKEEVAEVVRTHIEPALPFRMRATIENVTDVAEEFDMRLVSMGPQGNNAAGSSGMNPLQDGKPRVSDVDALLSSLDLNSGIRTTPVKNQFSLVPGPLSVFRDWWPAQKDKVEGTTTEGSVSYDGDTYVVTTDPTTTGRSFFETADVGRYRSGSIAIAGIYVDLPQTPVGTITWGYQRETNTNGLFFRYDSNEDLEFVVLRDGVETVIPQSSWAPSGEQVVEDENQNEVGVVIGIDGLQGNGPSGISWEPTDGYVYRVDFAWYGGGGIVPHIVETSVDGRQRSFPLFLFMPRGQTSISQPNQPVGVLVENNGTATSDTVRVAGRQFATAGDFSTEVRETTHLRENFAITTSWLPWLFVRRKDTIDGSATAEGIGFDLGPIQWALDRSIAFEARVGVIPGGSPDWQPPSRTSSNETALEVAETQDGGSALTVSDNGEKFGGALSGTSNPAGNLTESTREFGTPFPRQSVIGIFAKVTGTQSTQNSDLNATFPEGW